MNLIIDDRKRKYMTFDKNHFTNASVLIRNYKYKIVYQFEYLIQLVRMDNDTTHKINL